MEHMNAKPLKKEKLERILKDDKYVVERKLKGIRAFVKPHKDGCTIISRGGHNISHRFPHISALHLSPYIGKYLDGELYQEGIEDEVISGWGNHRTKNIDPSITKDVKFYAFDLVGEDYLWERRIELENSSDAFADTSICVLPYYEISCAVEMMERELSMGGEGVMIKNLFSLYMPGKRPENVWLKWKGEETFDVVILGFVEANEWSKKKGDEILTPTKFKGLIGAFIYGMYHKKEIIPLGTCSGMTDIVRKSMTHYPELWRGKVVEIKGSEQKDSGAVDNPRYIRMRDDKLPQDCIWRQ